MGPPTAYAVIVGSGINTVILGTSADTLMIAAINQSSAIFTTIIDIGAGDISRNGSLTGFANVTSKLGAALTSGLNDYQTFLDNASSGTTVGNLSWFQFAGDTFIVEDNSSSVTVTAGTDLPIKLMGLIDLGNSALANGDHTITVV